MRHLMLFVLVCLTGALVSVDTLVLRNGQRLEGRLVGVARSTIEFEERGPAGRTTLRTVDREDVLRIEFDRDSLIDEPGVPVRPSGLREKLVIVSGDVPWNDAGVDVRAGQELWFESSGTVWWGRDRRDGPAGERNSPRNDARPMPSRNAAALIGKVGARSSDYFFIGADGGPLRVRNSGRLFLGVNDDYLDDNRGNFRVIVYY